jgi:hypothetical protein
MGEEWNKRMMDETKHKFTQKGALQRPTIKQVCLWIKQSWSGVREDIVKYFKKCGISNALDGNEDSLINEEDNDDEEEEEEESSDDFSSILKVISIL